MPRAVVVGSGVAGPAAALALRRAGWDVVVAEAAAAPQPYAGLFLNVATNGLAVLDALGLRERLLADAHPAPRMVMWSGRGARLGEVPNGPAGEPELGSVIVRRGWLTEVLQGGLDDAGIAVRYGARLEAVDDRAGAVAARFADGSVLEGDLVVGADGLRSRVRPLVDPTAPAPRYRGLVGLGGTVRVHGLAPTPGEQHFLFGRRSFFGYLVRDDGTTYWFANATERDPAARPPGGSWLARLRDLHADDPDPVPRILAAVDEEPVPYPVFDLTGVRRWSRARLVLVGDAAHATTPSVGQGASLALEDAVALARHLRAAPAAAEQSGALAAYEQERRPRAERVAAYARAVDRHKRIPRTRAGAALRDAVVPLFLRRAASDRTNAWLYEHPVDAAPATHD